jgi:putative transposase
VACFYREGSKKQDLTLLFCDLFKAHLDNDIIKEIRNSTNGNFVLGDARFKEEVSAMLKRRVTPLRSGRPFKVD